MGYTLSLRCLFCCRVDLAVEAVRRMQATAKVQRDTVFAQLVASSPDLPQRLLVEVCGGCRPSEIISQASPPSPPSPPSSLHQSLGVARPRLDALAPPAPGSPPVTQPPSVQRRLSWARWSSLRVLPTLIATRWRLRTTPRGMGKRRTNLRLGLSWKRVIHPTPHHADGRGV